MKPFINVVYKSKHKIILLLTLCLFQSSCYATQQSYPSPKPTTINAHVPSLAKREEDNLLAIDAGPNATCHGGIGYYNINNKWKTMDLPTLKSSQSGGCIWKWKVPEDAKNGVGEFRGYIEQDGYSRNIFPTTFCIEVC